MQQNVELLSQSLRVFCKRKLHDKVHADDVDEMFDIFFKGTVPSSSNTKTASHKRKYVKVDLEKLSIRELKDICDEKSIKLQDACLRGNIIQLILKSQQTSDDINVTPRKSKDSSDDDDDEVPRTKKRQISNENVTTMRNSIVARTPKKVVSSSYDDEYDSYERATFDSLMNKQLHELKQMCKDENKAITGTKTVLARRLMGKEPPRTAPKTPIVEHKTPKTPLRKKQLSPTTHKTQKKSAKPKVVDVIQQNQKSIFVKDTDIDGKPYSIDEETGHVYKRTENVVVGMLNDDGHIRPLTEEEREKCRQEMIPVQLMSQCESDTEDSDNENIDALDIDKIVASLIQ
jgi:hypothetical protein